MPNDDICGLLTKLESAHQQVLLLQKDMMDSKAAIRASLTDHEHIKHMHRQQEKQDLQLLRVKFLFMQQDAQSRVSDRCSHRDGEGDYTKIADVNSYGRNGYTKLLPCCPKYMWKNVEEETQEKSQQMSRSKKRKMLSDHSRVKKSREEVAHRERRGSRDQDQQMSKHKQKMRKMSDDKDLTADIKVEPSSLPRHNKQHSIENVTMEPCWQYENDLNESDKTRILRNYHVSTKASSNDIDYERLYRQLANEHLVLQRTYQQQHIIAQQERQNRKETLDLQQLVDELNATIRHMEDDNTQLRMELERRQGVGSMKCTTPSDSPSFQESGIFEGELEELVCTGTQTSCDETSETESEENDKTPVQLSAEIEKLTRFREAMLSGAKSVSLNELNSKLGDAKTDQELARLEEENKRNKMLLADLEKRLNAKESSEQRLMWEIRDMDERIQKFRLQNAKLEEERCEFEEAENDTRLKYQRLEEKMSVNRERLHLLQEEVAVNRRLVDQLRSQLLSSQEREHKLKSKVNCSEALAQGYEERNFELEEETIEQRCRLQFWEICVPVLIAWNIWNTCCRLSASADRQLKAICFAKNTAAAMRGGKRELTETQEPIVKRQKLFNNSQSVMMKKRVEEIEVFPTKKQQWEKRESELLERIGDLENCLELLRNEVSQQRQKVGIFHPPDTSSRNVNEAELVTTITQIIQEDANLRLRVSELEKKENAYQLTMQEADRIMSSMESRYHNQISELQERISVLENSEKQLQETLHIFSRGNSQESFYSQRLQEEKNKAEEQHAQLLSQEKEMRRLQQELMDQGELIMRLNCVEHENANLSVEISRIHELQKRLDEVQQSEHFFKSRVEELEIVEVGLREAIQQADSIMRTKEKKFSKQIADLDDELATLRAALSEKEDVVFQAARLREESSSLKEKLSTMKSELNERIKFMETNENSLKKEISRLKTHFTTKEDQLGELESANSLLYEHKTDLENQVQNLTELLERAKHNEEQHLIHFNLQLCNKDDEIRALNEKVEEAMLLKMQFELNSLAESEGGLYGILKEVVRVMSQVQACPSCQTASKRLQHAQKQLSELTAIISGCKTSASVCNLEELMDVSNIHIQNSQETNVTSELQNEDLAICDSNSNTVTLVQEMHKVLYENSSLCQELEEKEEEIETMAIDDVDTTTLYWHIDGL